MSSVRVGSWRAESGEVVEVVDVVGGADPDDVTAVVDLHRAFFPGYAEVREDIPVDAALPSRREGVVVHQWLLRVDRRPAGIVLFESNLVRRCGPVLFFAVEAWARPLRVEGNQLSKTSTWLAVPQMLADGGPDMLGGCAERDPDYPARLVRLDVAYAEPVGGRHWAAQGRRWHPMSLHWTPRPDLRPVTEVPGRGHDVTCRIAAAYLIDHYRLPRDEPFVREMTGPQADVDAVVDRWPGRPPADDGAGPTPSSSG